MAKQKITWKGPPTGSLASRSLLTALILLVLPLILHTYYLYDEEYAEKLRDIKRDLVTLGNGQKALLEEKIDLWQLILERNLSGFPIKTETKATPTPFVKLTQDGLSLKIERSQGAFNVRVLEFPIAAIIETLLALNTLPYQVHLRIVSQDAPPPHPEHTIVQQIPVDGTEIALRLMVEENEVDALHRRDVLLRMLSLLFFTGIFGGILVWLLVWRLAKPLKGLCIAMHRVSKGEIQTRYHPDPMGFEIDALGRQFNDTLDAIVMHEKEAMKQRMLKEKLQQELSIGREIQANLIPKTFAATGLEIEAKFWPAEEVAGDFYDVFSCPEEKSLLVIADAAGKGIPACLYSLGLRSSLRTLASSGADLPEIIERAGDLFFLDAGNTSMFVTLWAALFDPKQRTLTYTCQGHPPALLLTGNTILELSTPGIALGLSKVENISTQTIFLGPEDLLLLYTDGVIEAHNKEGKLYGLDRLKNFLRTHKTLSLEKFSQSLIDDVSLYAKQTLQHDDITFLVVKQH